MSYNLFFVKAEAIDVVDQSDISIDNNTLCATLSNKLFIVRLFSSDDYLNLWINLPYSGLLSCKIINTLGQIMFSSESIDLSRGINQVKIPIYNLTGAIYLLEINFEGKILMRLFNKI